MADLTVIILTLDEAPHIERCIESISPIARRIIVVDSGSSDNTIAIAEAAGAETIVHPFESQAQQLNWTLDNVQITTAWTMRLDADEYLMPELAAEIDRRLPVLSAQESGIALRRRVVFMGRWIRHGGIYPTSLLRIWRTGLARSEDRTMDEHMILSIGTTVTFKHDLVDENLNDLTWWTAKHNGYASREASELRRAKDSRNPLGLDGPASRSRRAKEGVYLRLPPVSRAWLYFLYRYVLRFGLLDGREGLIFHTLQGLWYRVLADAKALESRQPITSADGDEEKGASAGG